MGSKSSAVQTGTVSSQTCRRLLHCARPGKVWSSLTIQYGSVSPSPPVRYTVPNKPGSTLAAGNRSISLTTRTRSPFIMFSCCKVAFLDQTVDDVPRLGLLSEPRFQAARVVDHRIQLMV